MSKRQIYILLAVFMISLFSFSGCTEGIMSEINKQSNSHLYETSEEAEYTTTNIEEAPATIKTTVSIEETTIENTFTTTETVAKATTQQPIQTANYEKNYILNNNTLKFHKPTCYTVSDIDNENIEYYTGSAEDLVSRGYIACKKCNPK